MKHDIIAITFVSALLLIYTILASLEVYLGLVFLLVGISPFLIIWMVWTVLKHGEYDGPELDSDQEFGYLDR